MSMPGVVERVAEQINESGDDIFLRRVFHDQGGYRRVARALAILVQQGCLIRIGVGIYARAAPSPFDGRPVLTKGFLTIVSSALNRLGVDVHPSAMTQAYNAG